MTPDEPFWTVGLLILLAKDQYIWECDSTEGLLVEVVVYGLILERGLDWSGWWDMFRMDRWSNYIYTVYILYRYIVHNLRLNRKLKVLQVSEVWGLGLECVKCTLTCLWDAEVVGLLYKLSFWRHFSLKRYSLLLDEWILVYHQDLFGCDLVNLKVLTCCFAGSCQSECILACLSVNILVLPCWCNF